MLGKEILCIKMLKVSYLLASCKEVVSLLCLSDEEIYLHSTSFLE